MKNKIVVFLLVIFSFTNAYSLSGEFENLNYKLEILEKSTDRILNALYVTIGFILAAVVGLNIWNSFSQIKNTKEVFEREALRLREETRQIVDDKLKSEDTYYLKKKIKDIEEKQIECEIHLLINANKLLSPQNILNFGGDYEASIKYLSLASQLCKSNGNSFYLSYALKNISELLINNTKLLEFQIDNISNILSEIDNRFEKDVKKIKEIIEKKSTHS